MNSRSLLQSIKVKAAIAFIVGHFISSFIYNVMVSDGVFSISQGGFIMHMLQASIYLFISSMAIDTKLRVASLATTVVYVLIAINWLLLERGIELKIQSYFYDSFTSIIMTINLIVICLLGKDGALYLLNKFFGHSNLHYRVQLFLGGFNNNSVRSINLPFSTKNNQSKEECK